MLKRRSIRTKLFVVLGLLTATVCLLAFSGIWGLYRYRRLAAAISDGAAEITTANDLNWLAESLRSSNQRLIDHKKHEGMIVDGGLFDPSALIRLEEEDFLQVRYELGRALDGYEQAIGSDEIDSLLVDGARRSENLQAIRHAFDAVEVPVTAREKMLMNRLAMQPKLNRLADATKAHSQSISERMSQFSKSVNGEYRTWITVAWTCTALTVIMVGTLLWAFWAMLVQPFRTLLGGCRLVAGGQFGHRIYLQTGDELNELADGLNEMTEKFQVAYEHSDQLRRSLEQQVRDRTREVIRNEQLASVGFLAAGVAHEINNPLTTIAWGAESLECQVSELQEEQQAIEPSLYDALKSTLGQIQSEAFRCKGITDRLLDFSRMSEIRREPTDLGALVKDVVELVSKVGEFRCKSIRTQCNQSVVAHVNTHQIRQVVLNLVTNALESVDSDGAVEIAVSGDGRWARIHVQDNGCGMSEEVKTHLFEPFFTRRRDGTGTGLGLSITYRIVSQHGGSLTPFSDGEGLGSRLELVLPIEPESSDTLCSSEPQDRQVETTGWMSESFQAA